MRHDTNYSEMGNHGGSLATTFLAGALAGAAVALLYAPARGRETRTYLRTKARESADTASRAVDSGRQMFKRGKARLDDAVGEGQRHLEDAAEHATRAYNEVRQAGREGRAAADDVATDVRRSTSDW